MKPLDPLIEGKIRDLARRLRDLREKSGSRCHPSGDIWREAISLSRKTGLARVAKGLGVSVGGLRNWNTPARGAARSRAEPRSARFLEIKNVGAGMGLPPPVLERRTSLCPEARNVELVRPDGTQLKISDLQAHGLDLRGLVQGFLAFNGVTAGGSIA